MYVLKMSGGALAQLVAIGQQDKHITPGITFLNKNLNDIQNFPHFVIDNQSTIHDAKIQVMNTPSVPREVLFSD
jgi:hypothetical protein